MSLMRRIKSLLSGREVASDFAPGTATARPTGQPRTGRDAAAGNLPVVAQSRSPALFPAFDPPEEFQRALRLIESGLPIVFVTGRAGTGKTTFVRWLRETLKGNVVVVAPTGLAALNSGGQTIHSFFRFPPRPITDKDIHEVEKRALYEAIDVLVVDEASMLRSDLLDGIDRFLRLNRRKGGLPFGGAQLVLVGDLYQLPPVVAHAEEALFLASELGSPYFFASRVLQDADFGAVEFTTAYRHPDPDFDALLTTLREGQGIDAAVLRINSECLRRPLGPGAVTLTCTNRRADHINSEHLAQLDGPAFTYRGEIRGKVNIGRERLPAPFLLELKPNAQVMFTKNDSLHRWVNGMIGRVSSTHPQHAEVDILLGTQTAQHQVGTAEWETVRHKYDFVNHQIVTEVIGKYIQLPLTLAWAITIHKSQGLTLDRVKVDFGDGAFAPGQAYVALSRCRSLEGLSLVRPLRDTDVKVDPLVTAFYHLLRDRIGGPGPSPGTEAVDQSGVDLPRVAPP